MKNLKTLLLILALATSIESCKKENKPKVNYEIEAMNKIDNTVWVAYKGYTWSQQTNMVDLTPEQIQYISKGEVKIAKSNISMELLGNSRINSSFKFVQLVNDYQFRIDNYQFQFTEFYVNKEVNELRIYIDQEMNTSTTYMIYFKKK